MKTRPVPCPPQTLEAERLTWDCGATEDRRWRRERFALLPPCFQVPAAKTYLTLHRVEGAGEANTYLRELAESCDDPWLRLALDEDKTRIFATNRASEASRIALRHYCLDDAYAALSQHVAEYGLVAPAIDRGVTTLGAVTRMKAPRWWQQQSRSLAVLAFEIQAIRSGMVHAKAGLYISEDGLDAIKRRRARNLDLLRSMEAINELDQKFSLADLVAKSVSNPINRRNELMARLHGFDVIAQQIGHSCIFVTVTCPSRMHARYKKSGDPNPNYDGTTPGQAQRYLCRLWARIRASLKTKGLPVYGFRVAEPQHDATPHWHFVLYCAPEHLVSIQALFTEHALRDSPDEKGAILRRCTFKLIDWAKGTGIGYIAKYISKNIDGEHLEHDLHGRDAKESALRVAAWSSVHRIRQFQQFGGPSVTCWRELRRINEAPEGLLEDAREAANAGDWEQFTELFGGPHVARKEQQLRLQRETTGEIGIYGDLKSDVIVGVAAGDSLVCTREHHWRLTRKSRGRWGRAQRAASGPGNLEYCQ